VHLRSRRNPMHTVEKTKQGIWSEVIGGWHAGPPVQTKCVYPSSDAGRQPTPRLVVCLRMDTPGEGLSAA